MKKYFVAAVAVLAVLAVALPASAKVEFSYGGLFRARIISQGDFTYTPGFGASFFDPVEGRNFQVVRDRNEDTLNRLDQRLRLFFDFIASENLRLVTKFEANEIWGNSATGGKIGADHPNDFVVKNAYLDFNIPNGAFPLKAKVGVQGINLLNSWVIDDDFSSANLTGTFDNVKVMMGYASGQNNDVFDENENIDDWFMAVDWVCGPWSANFVAFYQDGNDTLASADPALHTGGTPVGGVIPNRIPAAGDLHLNAPRNFFQRYFMMGNVGDFFPTVVRVNDNNLIDLGFTVKYKNDWLSAYLTFIKNLGSIEFGVYQGGFFSFERNMDYTGWMVDAGGSYFCGPFTFNLGGFYTTGPEDLEDSLTPVFGGRTPFTVAPYVAKKTGDIDWFTYPVHTTKYFSEIIGGGILDNVAPQHEDFQWRGYQAPSNIWTVNLGAAWQVMPSTKLSFSYWYFGTSEDVVSGPKNPGLYGTQSGFLTAYFNGYLDKNQLTWDSEIGHEFNLGITHKIVDGLTLDLVAAYLIAGDAYSMRPDDLDALEMGARLQWTF